MGLNLNYSLFMEGANSRYKLPEYKTSYIPAVLEGSYFSELVTEFNLEIMEAQHSLNTISEEAINLDEVTNVVNIKESIRNIVDRVLDALRKIWHSIIEGIKRVIKFINEKVASIKDGIDEKYSMHERNNLLAKAIREASPEEKKITISDIHPTPELLSKDFPDTSVMGKELADMATKAVDSYCVNINLKDGTDPKFLEDDIKASESLASYLEGQRGEILSKIFGKYSVDPTDIIGSAIKASEAAFGTKDAVSTDVNLELYGQACENLDKWKEVVSGLEKEISEVDKNYRAIEESLNAVKNESKRWEKLASPEYTVDIKARYHEGVREIVSNINRILNVVQQAVSANSRLLADKTFRINQVFSPIGDSGKVKRHCHSLIRKYVGVDDQVQESVNGVESIGSDLYFDEGFYTAVSMAETMLNEASFNDTLMEYLVEADGDTVTDDTSNAGGGDQQQNNDQNQNNIGNKLNGVKDAVQGFIDKLLNQLTEAFNKFKARITDLVTKIYAKYWVNNRDRIGALTLESFGNTKVNQWFVYNLESLSKEIVEPFDPNADWLKSDEDCQNHILEKIGKGVQFGEKDGFGEKVKKSFYTDYKNDNGEGVPLSQAGFDAKKVFDFVDGCMNQNLDNSSFKSISSDFKTINDNAKNIKDKKDTFVSQMKAEPAEASGEANQNANGQTAGNNGNKAGGEANASFRFDLADHFGLMKSTPLFEVVNADPNAVQGDTSNGGSGNKEFDARVRRYIKYYSLAVTAKMTSAIGAFKQYMDLYRAIIKDQAPKKEENNQQQNDQNNQNQ